MRWNWQQADWPEFTWNEARLVKAESRFLRDTGALLSAARYLDVAMRDQFMVETLQNEALTTSAIEGEILDRDSVQSSIRRQFGLATDSRRVRPAEQGIAELTVAVYRTFDEKLTHKSLFAGHRLLMKGRGDLDNVGAYRTGEEPMQIVSGALDAPKVHFEAPPAPTVKREMDRFLDWFERTRQADGALPALTRAGIAHLWFISIHPFEDGNGRLARAIAEKALAQGWASRA